MTVVKKCQGNNGNAQEMLIKAINAKKYSVCIILNSTVEHYGSLKIKIGQRQIMGTE